jgi:hypothetical protein
LSTRFLRIHAPRSGPQKSRAEVTEDHSIVGRGVESLRIATPAWNRLERQ